MKGIVTINTDAGFYPLDKVGSYAYWIRGDGFLKKGSGMFKEECRSSTECEKKAIINALTILLKSGYKAEKIIINRDNINAKAGKNGDEYATMMSRIIKKIKKNSIPVFHKNYAGKYFEFRHVKAHLHTKTARHWVNDWCDKMCTEELKKWRRDKENKQLPSLINKTE